MVQLLIGMLLGAMVTTETGRSIGNQLGDAAVKGLNQVGKTVAPEFDEEEGHNGKSA